MSGSRENILNATPLITVSGDLNDFILSENLSSQITSDLGRQNIQWHRSYDVPILVYLEANFVPLDEQKHLLIDHIARCDRKRNVQTVSPRRTPPAISANPRRHHSFNIHRQSPRLNSKPFESLSGSEPNATLDECQEEVNNRLFKLIGLRYLLTNGAHILTNSFWLDACSDLESYNQSIRDNLMDWFTKILTLTAYYNQIGLYNEFWLEFCIIIVIRSITAEGQSPRCKQHSEQVLSLEKLIESTDRRNGHKFLKNSSFTNAQSVAQNSTLNTNLSTSLSSLSGLTSTALSYGQLVDQIRNDLLVCFQLFQQKQFQNGNFDSNIPANNGQIAAQLLERILIFDSTPNASHSQAITTNGTNNPIISSTAKTFSALSGFSSGKNPGSKLASPSKGSLKGFKSSSTVPTVSHPAIQNYSSFVTNLRSLLLESYSRQFDAYEKAIRRQRELRNKVDWDFFGFFLLQEELAFAYENLGLYNKALIQYDELDALFSQSILNTSNCGIGPRWLQKRIICDSKDSERSSLYSSWNGLCLCNPDAVSVLREKIVHCVHNCPIVIEEEEELESLDLGSPEVPEFGDPLGVVVRRRCSPSLAATSDGRINLIDFRNYLFARQCHLLCLLNMPWDLASRALPFLQTCVTELNILEIPIQPGGVACWVFLSVLEILQKCERYSDSSQLESYSYHTVGLWSYARNKLAELGKICNLMPGSIDSKIDSSEHLHRMVELVAGMGADPHVRVSHTLDNETWLSPQERLKESLSSVDAFLKHYLELTELTMGTYKHIGYIRSARLIGKELSELYLKLQKPQQALPFLLDFYNMYQVESWTSLKLEASRLLAQCLEQLYFSAFQSPEAETLLFNLEATVRGAFRTYLLLFLYHAQIDSQQTEMKSLLLSKSYYQSVHKLLQHYNENGIKLQEIFDRINLNGEVSQMAKHCCLERPLLVIHNCYSDLLNESNPASGANSSSSNSSTSNLYSSTSSRMRLGASESNLFGKNFEHQLSSIQYFIRVADLEICCESNTTAAHTLTSTHLSFSQKSQSFIAGSLLYLKLLVVSYLPVEINLAQLFVSLDCSSYSRSDSQKELNEGTSNSGTSGGELRMPHAMIESFHKPNPGIRCLNPESLLKRQYSSGTQKFMSQLPVSLLNQRLSEDQNNFKNYKFLSVPFCFELIEGEPTVLKPGVNEFRLRFQSPENFDSLLKNSNQSLAGGGVGSENNQLWFNFDQLVLLCQLPPPFDPEINNPHFAIVDDFHLENCSAMAPFFRLVKCPPMIELVPKIETQHYSPFLIGIDQLVYLRINSGTNVLPKGMKCFIKISPLVAQNASIDYRSVNVTLSETESEENILYFHLDRQLNPFETYELELCLKSSFSKPLVRLITSKSINSSKRINIHQMSELNQRDFQLAISWSHLDSSNYSTVNASCRFTLYEPFYLQTHFHTSINQKFLQISLHGCEQLAGKYSLQFRFPQITFEGNVDSSPTNLIFKPLLFTAEDEDSGSFGLFELHSKQELNFVWQLFDVAKNASLRQFTLNLAYRSADLRTNGNQGSSQDITVAFNMRIQFDYSLLYVIRQSVVPLPGTKTSELLRIGNPCLFRVRIEKQPTRNSDYDDEYVMYELVCDPELWSLVKTSGSGADSDSDSTEEQSLRSFEPSKPSLPYQSYPPSYVIKLCEKDPAFETAFEVAPLTSGYIPIPYVRLSRYVSYSREKIDSPAKETAAKPKTIESLSKNLTKLMQNHLGGTKNHTSGLMGNDGSHCRSASLLPFEPGQVFNNNRASQVYVLPSNIAND